MSKVYKIQINDGEPIEVSQQVYEVSFCFNEMLKEKEIEIERLNNIINELEKWLEDVDIFQMNFIENKKHITPYKAVLDKLQELKGSNSNE